MDKTFEFREHTADIQLIAYGKTFEELCVHASQGMIQWMFGEGICPTTPSTREEIRVEGQDREDLLVEWLSQILWHALTKYTAAVSYQEVKYSGKSLQGKVDFSPCQAKEDIKAVTYHDLQVRYEGGAWSAKVTFDI